MATHGQYQRVRDWLMEAPFDDPKALAAQPDFSYEDWFDEGRTLPQAVEILIELLKQENLSQPSGEGMRIAYALGWIGDQRNQQASIVLLRALDSIDVALRIEAAAALGRTGDIDALPTLEEVLMDEEEDIDVRANACISIGRLGAPSSEKLLHDTLDHSIPFLVTCAEEALRLHSASS